MNLVSMCCISVRISAISFLALSKITRGSCDVHRKQFGAMTIAKLLASILVTCTISAFENIYEKLQKINTSHPRRPSSANTYL